MLKVSKPPYMPGEVIQVVNFQTGVMTTGTGVIPDDDTIPQKTEGNEYMAWAIEPKFASSKLKIEVVANISPETSRNVALALFRDEVANALASIKDVYGNPKAMSFNHFMIAGTTSEITFKVRAGCSVSTTITFNGESGTRRHGGVMASSITITEIKS